jgi:hypothetical protein
MGRISQPGENRKLKMVVSIHEAWQNEVSAEVNIVPVRYRPWHAARENARYAIAGDLEASVNTFIWPHGAPGSAK